MVMGHGVTLGLEFGNCTHTHVTRDHDTMVLPIPVIFPRKETNDFTSATSKGRSLPSE